MTQLVDLSHRITDGMVTYPGLPVPEIGTHLSREAAEDVYGPGITFHIGVITMCTNTGTYLDVPFHRYADGHDRLARRSRARLLLAPAAAHDRRHHRRAHECPHHCPGAPVTLVLVRMPAACAARVAALGVALELALVPASGALTGEVAAAVTAAVWAVSGRAGSSASRIRATCRSRADWARFTWAWACWIRRSLSSVWVEIPSR